MGIQRSTYWLVWLGAVALLALCAAAPFVAGPASTPYTDAGISVLSFVLALLAVTAGVGSMAVHESLLRAVWAGALDPRSAPGSIRLLRSLAGAWTLCLVIGGLGFALAWASARPTSAWPYLLAATALLAFHSPRAAVFGASRP
jgi:hypothetical protein